MPNSFSALAAHYPQPGGAAEILVHMQGDSLPLVLALVIVLDNEPLGSQSAEELVPTPGPGANHGTHSGNHCKDGLDDLHFVASAARK